MEVWFPTLESNQGTISVAALVLALVAFVVELYRANTQRRRDAEQEIEEAIIVIENLEELIEGADEYGWVEGDINEVEILASALRALAAAHVRKPTISLPLLRAAQIADSVASLTSAELRKEVDELFDKLGYLKGLVEQALQEARQRVVFRRAEQQKVQRATARAIKTREKRNAP